MLAGLRKLDQIRGTGWIEFNISGTPEKFDFNQEDSRYLDESGYNLFVDIVEKNSSFFNFYGPSLVGLTNLQALKLDLEKRRSEMSVIRTIDEFIAFAKYKNFQPDFINEMVEFKNSLDERLDKENLIDTNPIMNDIIEVVDKCMKEKRVLWVLGACRI
jgi:hypothetical protein